jgi:hypothetical protein
MNLINYGHIIGRENNVVRVDFGREADPPAPKFPGANGLRPVKKEVASIGSTITVLPRWLSQANSSKTLTRLPA